MEDSEEKKIQDFIWNVNMLINQLFYINMPELELKDDENIPEGKIYYLD